MKVFFREYSEFRQQMFCQLSAARRFTVRISTANIASVAHLADELSIGPLLRRLVLFGLVRVRVGVGVGFRVEFRVRVRVSVRIRIRVVIRVRVRVRVKVGTFTTATLAQ